VENGIKRCSDCKLFLPFENFSRSSKTKDGLWVICRACVSIRNRKYRQENAERILERNRIWRKNNPEKSRASTAKYRKAHLDGSAARTRRWYYADFERGAACSKRKRLAWKLRDPVGFAKVFANSKRRYRARKNDSSVCDFTSYQWDFLRELYNHYCAYCGKFMQRMTQDHVVALSNGGNHTLTNILPSCQSCNSKKGADKFIIPYLLRCADGIQRDVVAFVPSWIS
jgi:5-methylcytosine-specific restriction endonuclease McrA